MGIHGAWTYSILKIVMKGIAVKGENVACYNSIRFVFYLV